MSAPWKASLVVFMLLGQFAYSSEPDQVLEWFNANASEAASYQFPDGFYVDITEFHPNYRPLKEIEDMISRSGESASSDLLQLREIAIAGGQKIRTRLWYKDDTHWRVAQDKIPSTVASAYTDSASNGNILWVMTANTLHATDTQALKHRGKWVDPNYFKRSILFSLFRSIFAISPPPIQYMTSGPSETLAGDDFILRVEHSNPDIDYVNFRIQSFEDSYVVNDMRIQRKASAKPNTFGQRSTFSAWKSDKIFLHPVSWERVLFDADRIATTYTINEIRPLSGTDNMSKLVSLPTIYSDDPIRGKVTFETLMNHSDNEELFLSRTNIDAKGDSAIDIISKNRIQATTDDAHTLNYIGRVFIVSAILLAVGISIKFKKGSHR